MLIISPLIFGLIYNEDTKNQCKEIGVGVLVVIVSWVTTNFTNILSIYGGGGKLFGGTFLILLYIGMLVAKYDDGICLINKWHIVGSFISFNAMALMWWRFIYSNQLAIDSKLPFGKGYNPPSISLDCMGYFGC